VYAHRTQEDARWIRSVYRLGHPGPEIEAVPVAQITLLRYPNAARPHQRRAFSLSPSH
jgi:hypothetical protein